MENKAVTKFKLSLSSLIRIGIGVAVVIAFFAHEADWATSRFVQQLEMLAYDSRLRFFMPKTLDPRVVILDIDEKSLNAEGRWPWSRDKLALMTGQLFDRYKVRVLGFDVVFAEPDPSSGLEKLEGLAKNELKDNAQFNSILGRIRPSLDYDRLFADEISKHPVVLGFFLGGKTDKSGVLPPPVFDAASLGKEQISHQLATGVFRYISATDVIRGTVPVEELQDRIVIVGTSAQGLLDLRATPVREDYPGVEVHANLISGFLDQSIMHRPSEARTISVFTVLLIGLPFAILLPRLGALTATVAMAVLFVVVLAVNIYMWKSQHYVLSIAAPLLMLVLLYFMNMAYGFFAEARSRRLITSLFGTYVPKELVAEMSKNPEEYSMRGESREMSVFFSDVRDFTTISEGLTAEGLKDMMNAYLTAMTEVIQDKRGTIDKNIGDAIMAFWGAPIGNPDHARYSLEAALAMQKAIRRLDPDFVKRGWPPLIIGAGLNCGVLNVGDIGSKFRRAYTVMGDTVNFASRLEGLTKEYGVGILVSENVVNAVPSYVYREVDKVQVKGRAEGVAIFEPIGRLDEVEESTVELVDRFHRMLEHYRAQRWDEADKILVDLTAVAPETKLYKLFRQRIFDFRYNAPDPAWNGVWIFKTK